MGFLVKAYPAKSLNKDMTSSCTPLINRGKELYLNASGKYATVKNAIMMGVPFLQDLAHFL